MPNLLTISKSFLEWAQTIPDVVIPAGLESDMQESIAEVEAVEQLVCAADHLELAKSCLDRCPLCESR